MDFEGFDARLIALARDVFEVRVPIDPNSRAGFYIRLMGVMFELQLYYKKEEKGPRRNALAQSVERLLHEYEDLQLDQEDLYRYLKDNLDYICREPSGTLTERLAWRSESLSSETTAIPGMLYPDTMRYYKWLARTYGGLGEIVELGCWMGQSTCCLAEGFQENPSRGVRKIHVFDSFRWEPWMEIHCTDPNILAAGLKEGDSFLALFRSLCESHLELLEVRQGFLGANENSLLLSPLSDCGNSRIGLIIFDVSADYATNRALWQIFSPLLIPNETIVVFNQFGNARAEAIRRLCSELDGQLLPVHKPTGSAKGFLYSGSSINPGQ